MRTRLLLLLMAFALPCALLAGDRDPEAVALAESTMQAMGGLSALQSIDLLRFDFAVEVGGEQRPAYRHWWAMKTGGYRLEGQTREGEAFRVLFNVHSREGRAWLGDRELEGDELTEWLERAYGRFINDSYWLLMPWKWLDPGVHLAFEGEREADGAVYDVVRLSFGADIGLTSNDRYWAWVSRDSGRMARWEYVLQNDEGQPGDADPRAFTWEEWKDTQAGVRLSTAKRGLGDTPVAIVFPVAEATSGMTEAALAAEMAPAALLRP